MFRKCVNIRDLGGYTNIHGQKVKSGLYYRSGALNLFNQTELELLKSFNIKFILDLRTKKESDANPDPIFENVEYLRHSGVETKEGKEVDFSPEAMMVIGADSDNQYAKLENYYVNVPYDNEALKIFFSEIKKANLPILFHCFTGKDRTGVAAMLLLGLLEVDKQTIIDDYLLSNEYHQEKIAQKFSESTIDLEEHPETKRLLMMCYGVIPKIGTGIYDGIINRYGSFEEYFKKEHCYTDEDIANVRNFSLEK